jgi:hypothetical protein
MGKKRDPKDLFERYWQAAACLGAGDDVPADDPAIFDHLDQTESAQSGDYRGLINRLLDENRQITMSERTFLAGILKHIKKPNRRPKSWRTEQLMLRVARYAVHLEIGRGYVPKNVIRDVAAEFGKSTRYVYDAIKYAKKHNKGTWWKNACHFEGELTEARQGNPEQRGFRAGLSHAAAVITKSAKITRSEAERLVQNLESLTLEEALKLLEGKSPTSLQREAKSST